MTETKHTPGPWVFNLESNANVTMSDGFCFYVGSENQTIDEIDANARLIAASPDLLEALADTLWGMDKLKEITGLNLETEYPVLFGHISRARAAIAKAKGEL